MADTPISLISVFTSIVTGLKSWVTGGSDETVTILGVTVPTLSKLIADIPGGTAKIASANTFTAAGNTFVEPLTVGAPTASGHAARKEDVDAALAAAASSADGVTPFATKALMDADAAHIGFARVGSDGDNNGLYYRAATSDVWAKCTDPDIAAEVTRAETAEQAILDGSFTLKLLPLETGYMFAIVDSGKRILATVDLAGQFYPRKLTIPQAAVIDDDTSTPIINRLPATSLTEILTASVASLPTDTGYMFAIVDSAKRILATVDLAGQIYPRKLTIPQAAVIDDDTSTPIVNRLSSNQYVAENDSYSVYTQSDEDGNYQLYSVNTTTGAVVQLTSSGHNIMPQITADNVVLFTNILNKVSTFCEVSAAGGTIYRTYPEADVIDCWGDSLTAGAGSSGTGTNQGPYPLQLAALLGWTCNNRGVGGQTSREIAARQGGQPSLLTVTDNTIPASGAVDVTAWAPMFPITNQGSSTLTGTLSGVAGTLTMTAYDSSTGRATSATFTRTTDGDETACPAETAFIPDYGETSRPRTQILALGRNNTNQAQILSDVAACVAYMTARHKRFIIMPVLNGYTEISGTSAYTTITAINAALEAAYPNNFCDTRTPPDSDEQTWITETLGYTFTETDLTQISEDAIPVGMHYDTIHLNNYGYALQARRLYNFIVSKGWTL